MSGQPAMRMIATLLVASLTIGWEHEYKYRLPTHFPADPPAGISGFEIWFIHLHQARLKCGATIYTWQVAPDHIPAGQDWQTVPVHQRELIDFKNDHQCCSIRYYFASGAGNTDWFYVTNASAPACFAKPAEYVNPVVEVKGSGCSG